MDNYLAPRWPEGPSRPVRPIRITVPAGAPRRRRKLWHNILAACLALVLLAGLGVGGVLGAQALGRAAAANGFDWIQGNGDATPRPSTGTSNMPGGDTTWTAERLPKADPDPAVQLSLLSHAQQETLSANEIYEKVLPSIVYVQAGSEQGYRVGSGVIVTASGYLLTNYHIIDGASEVSIMLLSDRSSHNASVVGFDEELDLAVLKAEGEGFVPAQLGNSDELRVGDPVYAIGNPMGYLFGVMTDGIVSALSSDRVAELNYPGRLIQTTAPLNSGNSGGALVDAYGRVVGITHAKVTGIEDDVVVEGISLAIPLADALPYLNRIFRTGETARPSVGISCYTSTRDGVSGVYVQEVTDGTPAVGKLKPGDLIIAANGVDTAGVDELTRVLSQLDPGDTVSLTVLRGGLERRVDVTIYDRLDTTDSD